MLNKIPSNSQDSVRLNQAKIVTTGNTTKNQNNTSRHLAFQAVNENVNALLAQQFQLGIPSVNNTLPKLLYNYPVKQTQINLLSNNSHVLLTTSHKTFSDEILRNIITFHVSGKDSFSKKVTTCINRCLQQDNKQGTLSKCEAWETLLQNLRSLSAEIPTMAAASSLITNLIQRIQRVLDNTRIQNVSVNNQNKLNSPNSSSQPSGSSQTPILQNNNIITDADNVSQSNNTQSSSFSYFTQKERQNVDKILASISRNKQSDSVNMTEDEYQSLCVFLFMAYPQSKVYGYDISAITNDFGQSSFVEKALHDLSTGYNISNSSSCIVTSNTHSNNSESLEDLSVDSTFFYTILENLSFPGTSTHVSSDRNLNQTPQETKDNTDLSTGTDPLHQNFTSEGNNNPRTISNLSQPPNFSGEDEIASPSTPNGSHTPVRGDNVNRAGSTEPISSSNEQTSNEQTLSYGRGYSNSNAPGLRTGFFNNVAGFCKIAGPVAGSLLKGAGGLALKGAGGLAQGVGYVAQGAGDLALQGAGYVAQGAGGLALQGAGYVVQGAGDLARRLAQSRRSSDNPVSLSESSIQYENNLDKSLSLVPSNNCSALPGDDNKDISPGTNIPYNSHLDSTITLHNDVGISNLSQPGEEPLSFHNSQINDCPDPNYTFHLIGSTEQDDTFDEEILPSILSLLEGAQPLQSFDLCHLVRLCKGKNMVTLNSTQCKCLVQFGKLFHDQCDTIQKSWYGETLNKQFLSKVLRHLNDAFHNKIQNDAGLYANEFISSSIPIPYVYKSV